MGPNVKFVSPICDHISERKNRGNFFYLKKTIKNSFFFRTPSFRDWWLDFQLSSISSPMGVVILRKSWPQMVTFQYYGLFCTMTRLWYMQRVHMKLKLKFKYLEKDLVTKEGQSIKLNMFWKVNETWCRIWTKGGSDVILLPHLWLVTIPSYTYNCNNAILRCGLNLTLSFKVR